MQPLRNPMLNEPDHNHAAARAPPPPLRTLPRTRLGAPPWTLTPCRMFAPLSLTWRAPLHGPHDARNARRNRQLAPAQLAADPHKDSELRTNGSLGRVERVTQRGGPTPLPPAESTRLEGPSPTLTPPRAGSGSRPPNPLCHGRERPPRSRRTRSTRGDNTARASPWTTTKPIGRSPPSPPSCKRCCRSCTATPRTTPSSHSTTPSATTIRSPLPSARR